MKKIVFAMLAALSVTGTGCSLETVDTSHVVWVKEPSMIFDRMQRAEGLETVPVYDGNQAICYVFADQTSAPESWTDGYKSGAVFVERYGKQGVMNFQGETLYPVSVNVFDIANTGILYTTYEKGMGFCALDNPDVYDGASGSGIVFEHDFRSVKKAKKVELNPVSGVMYAAAVRNGKTGLWNVLTKEFREYGFPEVKGHFAANLIENGTLGKAVIADADGHVYADCDEEISWKYYVNGYYLVGHGPYGLVKADTGERITDIRYDEILYYEDGYCPVRKGDKWGYLDTEGRLAVDCILEDASPLYNGKAYVKFNGFYGIMDLARTARHSIAVNKKTLTKGWTAWTKGRTGTATVLVENLNIRSGPGGDIVDGAEIGRTYEVYEQKEQGGYTWYRIDENAWLADNGSWVQYHKD
ncbi:MAG: WG repeat-containing protein [Solobacterium sp.]|nr:WG repeat-containing protein [Solobacterium sp.]